MITRRRFLAGSAAAVGLGAVGLFGYATCIEPFWVRLESRRMRLRNLPPQWTGRRVVHLSDLHVCSRVSSSHLRRCFHLVRELQPDVVLYTGDFVTQEPSCLQQFGQLRADLPLGRSGTYGVLGNHDYGRGWQDAHFANDVTRMCEAGGIRILRNRHVDLDGLIIAGVDEFWAARCVLPKAIETAPKDAATIVLCHNPDAVDGEEWQTYTGWILSGHTHGGQCRPPFLPPPLLPVRNKRYTAGEFDLGGGRTMYINPGLGYLRQVRFNVRPEITVFTLEPA